MLTQALWLVYGLAIAVPTERRPAEQKPLGQGTAVSKGILDVRAELKKAEIIPTVIDDFLPSLTVSVTWNPSSKSNKKHKKSKTAALGNTLKPKHLQSAPEIHLHDETNPDTCQTSNMTYVITLTDPDAPSRDDPKWSEMCHWIAKGVPLSSKTYSFFPSLSFFKKRSVGGLNLGANGLEDVVEYKPPGPPPKTGKHRYVFLVFAPENGTTLPLDLSKPEDRKHWGGSKGDGVRDWAKENGLVPVGANFIYAQNKEQ